MWGLIIGKYDSKSEIIMTTMQNGVITCTYGNYYRNIGSK